MKTKYILKRTIFTISINLISRINFSDATISNSTITITIKETIVRLGLQLWLLIQLKQPETHFVLIRYRTYIYVDAST